MAQDNDNAPFILALDNTDTAIRHGLSQVRCHLMGCGVAGDLCGTVEIVLAEALNNVVEHAYAPGVHDTIMLKIVQNGAGIHCEIQDCGSPLPGLALPQGTAPPLSGPHVGLPESGFGWYMIRSLTDDLHYRRIRGVNCLGFTVHPTGA